jgi:hypothetical protein
MGVMSDVERVSRLLLEHGLLDELRLWVHPLSGSRPPQRSAVRLRARGRLDLTDTTLSDGMVILSYQTDKTLPRAA